MQLKDATLLRQQCYVDGAWTEAEGGKTITVKNPASSEPIGTIPNMGARETRRAIEAAERAWPAWRSKTGKERANILRRWYDLVMANLDDLAVIMTTEQGKPLAESRGEVVYGASFIEWFAEEAKRIYGDTIPQHQPDKRIVVIKQPIGVVAAITPWNFPNAMITRKCAPALAAGCPVVIKPATFTPYSALALGGSGRAGRIAQGRVQRRHRIGEGNRQRDDLEPDRAQALLHRFDGDRQAVDGAMRRHGEEGQPRTRR